jgi:tetratricopeptide (TPR) repeat protein
VEKGKPIVLDSFSKDEASPVAKEHLAKAEDFMKQGKFTSALEEYDLVEQQSPSNPYVELGRANAELGASYYGLAEAHLRQAFTTDEALLSAQLDLRTFLGEDKIQYLVKDLKEIAQNNPTESRPVFLLAYICYNTNQPRGAAAYLDLAQRREGKADPFFALLRAHWDLPDVSDQNGGSGLNK